MNSGGSKFRWSKSSLSGIGGSDWRAVPRLICFSKCIKQEEIGWFIWCRRLDWSLNFFPHWGQQTDGIDGGWYLGTMSYICWEMEWIREDDKGKWLSRVTPEDFKFRNRELWVNLPDLHNRFESGVKSRRWEDDFAREGWEPMKSGKRNLGIKHQRFLDSGEVATDGWKWFCRMLKLTWRRRCWGKWLRVVENSGEDG